MDGVNGNLSEIKEEVVQALENKGVLGKLKAELRANVFSVLDGEKKVFKENNSAKRIKETPEVSVVVELLREFLEFYELEWTSCVLIPEANLPKVYSGRRALAQQLNLNASSDKPLLLELYNKIQQNTSQSTGKTNNLSKTSLSSLSTSSTSDSERRKREMEEKARREKEEKERREREEKERAERLRKEQQRKEEEERAKKKQEEEKKAQSRLSSLGDLPPPGKRFSEPEKKETKKEELKSSLGSSKLGTLDKPKGGLSSLADAPSFNRRPGLSDSLEEDSDGDKLATFDKRVNKLTEEDDDDLDDVEEDINYEEEEFESDDDDNPGSEDGYNTEDKSDDGIDINTYDYIENCVKP